MKSYLVGPLITAPFIWAISGWKIAVFSVVGALAIFGAITYVVNREWIK